MSAQIRTNEYNTKSLFTAVLYSDVPELSASSSTGEGSTYLKQIRREHLARASIEEVGSQTADSPNTQFVTKVAQLAERTKRAYSEANGNPADGRWIFVSDLLRLHCTRGGRHWIGTNTSVETPAIPEHLCIIPKTGDHWNQLDRKRKEEEDVKSRVQRWITAAEFNPLTPETTIVPESTVNEQLPFTQASLSVSQRPVQSKQTTLKAAYDPANSGNKFGFSVVKRSHVVGKGKPDFGATRRSSSPDRPVQQHAVKNKPQFDPSQRSFPSAALSARDSSVHMSDHISDFNNSQPLHEHNRSGITPAEPLGAPASSFLPPSFPNSQIETSTPKLDGASEAQSPPPTSSERLPSPSNDVVEISSPAVENELLPTSHLSESRKRVRSPSQGESEPPLKRARISHEADRFSSSPARRPDDEEMPLTPLKKNLPRLADLIASTRVQKPTPRKKSHSSKLSHPPMETVADITTNLEPPPYQNDSNRKENTKEPTPSMNSDHLQPAPDHNSGSNSCKLVVDASVVRVEAQSTLIHEMEALPSEHIPEKLLENHRVDANSDKPLKNENVLEVQESRPQTPHPPASPTSDSFRFPGVERDSLRAREATSYNLYGLDNLDNPSPAKSLSSLADSDSGSGSDEEDGDQTAENIAQDLCFIGHEFNPRFTSTQKPGLEPVNDVSGSFQPSDRSNDKLPSTSQLQAEINSQVDEFDKFMEADLSYDPVAPCL